MGLFVDRVVADRELEEVIRDAMRSDHSRSDDSASVAMYVAAAKQAATGKAIYHWSRVIVGIVIAAVLLFVGIVLALMSDSWAADQAMKAATVHGYTAPSSSLPVIATSVVALCSAWSGALVGLVLDSKSS